MSLFQHQPSALPNVKSRGLFRGTPLRRTVREYRESFVMWGTVALAVLGFGVVGAMDEEDALHAERTPAQLTVTEAVNQMKAQRAEHAALVACRPLTRRVTHTAEQVAQQCRNVSPQ